MGCAVEVLPWGKTFEVSEGETILQAALRSRISIPYGCRIGKCSTCKHLVLEGDVDLGDASTHSLLDSEREEGLALLCVARPRSDLVIELVDVEPDEEAGIEPVQLRATVAEVVPLTERLRLLRLDLDEGLEFRPGQYVEVRATETPLRQYSIASSAEDPHSLELVIKVIEGGQFSGRVDAMQPGEPLELSGPYGTAFFRPQHGPALLVAAGSGIGPMMGILRTLADTGFDQPLQFFYGARTRADLPFEAEIDALAKVLDLRYVPSLSGPGEDDGWDGEVGRVTHTIGRTFDPDGWGHAYVCGPPPMCDAVAYVLEGKGMAGNRIYQDAFYPAD